MLPVKGSVNILRAVVRPIVTFLVVAAFVIAAFVRQEAVEHLRELTFLVATFWFVERTVRRNEE